MINNTIYDDFQAQNNHYITKVSRKVREDDRLTP